MDMTKTTVAFRDLSNAPKTAFQEPLHFCPVAKSNLSLSIFEANISQIYILNYVTPISYYLLFVYVCFINPNRQISAHFCGVEGDDL